MAVSFTDAERDEIKRIVAQYPRQPAALLPVLHLAQDKFGHLSPEVQELVATTLDVPPTRVREVVTFYEMYHEHAEGQFHLELCTNISCHLAGADGVMDHLKKRLGIEIGHQTENGVFSIMEAECLASCGSAPVMKVGLDYYEQLTPEAVDALVERFGKDAPALGGKHYRCAKDAPHVGPVDGFKPKLPVLQAGAIPTAAPNPVAVAAAPAPAAAAPVAVPPPVPPVTLPPTPRSAFDLPPPSGEPSTSPTAATTKAEGKPALPSFDPKVPKRD